MESSEQSKCNERTVSARGGRARALRFDSSLLVGELVAERFQVRRLLGGGGFGEVYEAWDGILGQAVALKVLHPYRELEGPQGLDRLRREILLSRRVTHPHVCRVHDVVVHHRPGASDRLVITMELVEGPTLESWLHGHGPLDLREALPWIRQLEEALTAAHRAGVLHLDLKPANVLLAPGEKRGERRAVITDFGLARPLTASGDRATSGTPGFMAPEQERGEEVGPSADHFSLAAVVHTLLTGSPPDAGWPEPSLDPTVRRILTRGLAAEPGDRFPDAGSLVAELSRAAGVDIRSLAGGGGNGRRRFAAMAEPLAGLLLVALVLAGVSMVSVVWEEASALRAHVEPTMLDSRLLQPAMSPVAAQAVTRAREHLRRRDGAAARAVLGAVELRAMGRGEDLAGYHGALSDALWILGEEAESRAHARRALDAAVVLPRGERLVHEGRWRARSYDWPAAARLYDAAWTYGVREPEVGLALVTALQITMELDRATAVIHELRGQSGGKEDPRVELAAARLAQGVSGNPTMANHARRAVKLAEAMEAPLLKAEAHRFLGAALFGLGQFEAAFEELETALRLYRNGDNPSFVGLALRHLAILHEQRGDPETARRFFEESIAIQRCVGAHRRLPVALHSFAAFLLVRGETDAAVPRLEEAQRLFERVGDIDGVAAATADRGLAAFNQGRVDEAMTLFETALDLDRRLGRPRGELSVLNHLAEVYVGKGQVGRAAETWQEALELAQSIGDRMRVQMLQCNLAELAWMRGNLQEGRRNLQEVLQSEEVHPHIRAYARHLAAKLAWAAGDLEAARAGLQRAIEVVRSVGAGEMESLFGLEMAVLQSEMGLHDAAIDLALEAWAGLRSSTNPLYQQHGAAAAVSTLVAADRVEEARKVVDRLRRMQPSSTEHRGARLAVAEARLELAEGRPARARELLQAALGRSGVDRSLALDLRAWSLLATAHEALRAPGEAAELRRRIRAHAEDHGFVLGPWAERSAREARAS